MSVVLLRARCSNCTPGDALDTCGSSPYGSDGRDLPPWSSRPSPDHAKGHGMSDLVGFIGLGTMGMPMTANLARAGVALVVHDASPSATQAAGKLAGVAAAASAVAEALAVCVQSGVDPYTFYDVVRKGGGMAYGTYFERRAKRIFDGEFSPTFMCELMRKDAGLALALAKASKVPTPILEETKRTYDEAVDSGWGKEDFSAVTHVIEKRIGRKL